MKREPYFNSIYCFRAGLILLLLGIGSLCFAQDRREEIFLNFNFPGISENLIFTQTFSVFRLAPYASGSEDEQLKKNQGIFANSPQWVKDLRRGEIVFFGTVPFTVFFTRFFFDLYRMGMNDWDQRYAPWPFQSAGAVQMTSNELAIMFSIAASVSLGLSIVDHIIVRNKRKAANDGK